MTNKFFVVLLLIFSFAFLVSQNQSDNNRIRNVLETSNTSPTLSVTPTSLPTYAPGIIYAKRVIDGDTIELSTGQIVRYIGINTPEMNGKNKSIECFAVESLQVNKALVEGKAVRLEKDVSDKDKYGRLLRYVYVDDPSRVATTGSKQEEIFVNDYLVKNGYAQSLTYPPDIKHQDKFVKSQITARNKRLGIWKDCIYNEKK